MNVDPSGYMATQQDLQEGMAGNAILDKAASVADSVAMNIYRAIRTCKTAIPVIMAASSSIALLVADSPVFTDICSQLASGSMTVSDIQQQIIDTFVSINPTIWDNIFQAVNRSGGSLTPSNNSGGGAGSSGAPDPNNWKNLLTRTQNRMIQKYENTVHDHLKNSDFEAVKNELNGIKYPKPGGGYWNHIHEMYNSYETLERTANSLEGSLRNPNLDITVRTNLELIRSQAVSYMQEIDSIFADYGGIYGYK